MAPTIQISEFLRGRLAAELPFSHFDGSEGELLDRVKRNFAEATPGYRDGVLLVPVDPAGFFSPVCELVEGDKIVGEYKARRPGETPRVTVGVAGGKKSSAAACSIVLYSFAVLEEGDEPRTGADFDCVMIQARTQAADEPMEPATLMHNHFSSDGGTDTKMSAAEFEAAMGESFAYWRSRAMLAG